MDPIFNRPGTLKPVRAGPVNARKRARAARSRCNVADWAMWPQINVRQRGIRGEKIKVSQGPIWEGGAEKKTEPDVLISWC
eukprot:scaffold41905_cov30-Tisochrysis_lutea.AAC.1